MTVNDEVHALDVPAVPHWGEIAASIEALSPNLIELLDAKGKLIRAATADQFMAEEPSDEAKGILPGQQSTPEMAMLCLFAKLLSEAYRHSTTVAFDKMVDLFEAVNERATSGERALETLHKMLRKVYEENAELSVAAGEKEPDLLTTLASSFLAGQAQGQIAKTVGGAPAGNAPKTNGKKAPS